MQLMQLLVTSGESMAMIITPLRAAAAEQRRERSATAIGDSDGFPMTEVGGGEMAGSRRSADGG